MTTLQSNSQRLKDRTSDEDAATDTFAARLPPGRAVQLFGRNSRPPARKALVVALAIVVALLAIPIAAAVGNAVYDSRTSHYAEQEQARRVVTATVVGERDARPNPSSRTVWVPARWFDDGAEHTGVVKTERTVRTGDSLEIWVDEKGSQVASPVPTSAAAEEAAVAAVVIWLGAVLGAVGVFAGTRAVVNRVRHPRWQRDPTISSATTAGTSAKCTVTDRAVSRTGHLSSDPLARLRRIVRHPIGNRNKFVG